VTRDLREALRAEADSAPVYAVYDRAVLTARRRRHGRWTAAAAAVAVMAVLAFTALPGILAHPTAVASADAQPSLPDRLAFPPAFWPGVRSSPPGPASLIFGGQGFAVDNPKRLLDNEGDFAVVGATSDVYRVWRVTSYEAHAGEDVLLSPDGTRLAIPSGMNQPGPAVFDLRTGVMTRLAAFGENDYVTPMAWSPDGRTLAVQVVRPDGVDSVGLVDVPAGAYQQMSEVDRSTAVRGFGIAWAPDGLRWAYQDKGEIVVADRNLKAQARFAVPGDAWLAGKGAWTADGKSLVTVQVQDQQWALVERDPATGAIRGQRWVVGGADLAAVRLIGWAPGGEPVVVAFRAEPTMPVTFQPETAYQAVHSLQVWRLDAAGHTVLLTAPHNLMSIDIADAVLAGGRQRAADPPRFGPLTFAGGFALLALVFLVVRVAQRRYRRVA
jgi:hypothetical protein